MSEATRKGRTNLVISPVLILYSMRVFNNVSVLENGQSGGETRGMYSSHVRRVSSPASVEQNAERDGDHKVGDHGRPEAGIEQPLRNGARQTRTRGGAHIEGGVRTHIRSDSAYVDNLNLQLDELGMKVGGNEGR